MSDGLSMTLYQLKESQNEYSDMDMIKIANRWNAKASVWDEQLKKEGCHLNQDGAYDSFIIDAKALLANIETDKTGNIYLLEIGCGTAVVSDALQKKNLRITGIDISPEMIKLAIDKKILNSNFHVLDVFSLPQHTISPANLILSRGILLSHYSEDEALRFLMAMRECCYSDRSIVMVDFLNSEATDQRHYRPDNKTYFSPSQLKKLSSLAGFTRCYFSGEKTHRARAIILKK